MNTTLEEFLENWEIGPEAIHPRALELLNEDFWWNPLEESSPFGNDDGHDALSHYLEWRAEHPNNANPTLCIKEILEGWGTGVDQYWEVIDPNMLQKLRQTEPYGVSSRDNALFAVAFGQFALEGKMHPTLKTRALIAVQRQSLPTILDDWGEGHRTERLSRLKQIKAVLDQL